MSQHMPESYWNDVNRYCREILAGTEKTNTNLFVIGATSQNVAWEAETANTTAVLSQDAVYYLGGLIRNKPTHTLSLEEPTPGTDKMVDYRIAFSLDAEVISSINNGLEFKPPMPGDDFTLRKIPRAWKDFFAYLSKNRQDWKEKKAHGFHLPTEEDYHLLHNELKRGVSGEYTIRDR